MTPQPDSLDPHAHPRVEFPPTRRSVLTGFAVLGAVVLLVLAREALAPYIFGVLLVFVMNSVVDRLSRWGLPRPLATVATIVIVLAAVLLFVYVILSEVVRQGAELVAALPSVAVAARSWIEASGLPDTLRGGVLEFIDTLPSRLPSTLPFVFGVFITVGTNIAAVILAISGLPFWIYYALADRPKLMAGMRRSLPAPYRPTVVGIVAVFSTVFGSWIRGQLILAAAVGIPFFIGFSILGVLVEPALGDYALLFAVAFGLAEFVPIIGPVIVFIPILIISAAAGGLPAIVAVVPLFVVIQLIEGSYLIPRVQGRALNLHPVIILPALVVGSALFGLMGAVLALPMTAAIRRTFNFLWTRASRPARGVRP